MGSFRSVIASSLSLCAWAGHMARTYGAAACGAQPSADQRLAGCPSVAERPVCRRACPPLRGPRVVVLRVRWGLSWPSAGKREGGSQPRAWHPPGAVSVYPGTARLGTAR